jgi:RNA polymerase sigma-70 factor (ECF subfamily)
MVVPDTKRESPIRSLRDCSEKTLRDLLLTRHDGAWSEFIRRYRGLIYHCINRIMKRHFPETWESEADEIYSEVLMMLLDDDMAKLRIFNPRRGCKLGTWVGMLSANAARDYLRCAKQRPWLDYHVELAPEMLPNQHSGYFVEHDSLHACSRSPMDRLLDKERWSHLEELVIEFSYKDRRFLYLYYTQGFDADGVADCLAINLNTVYSKKHKIRKHLRRGVRDAGRTCVIRDMVAA